MRTGRPIAPLSLVSEERETLERWARRPKSAQALAQRSRIVLECAAGNSAIALAHKLKLTHQTVGKWRQRFVQRRLDGLLDEPRRPERRAKSVTPGLSGWCGSPWRALPSLRLTLEHARHGQAQWSDYLRHGTINPFAALEAKAGTTGSRFSHYTTT